MTKPDGDPRRAATDRGVDRIFHRAAAPNANAKARGGLGRARRRALDATLFFVLVACVARVAVSYASASDESRALTHLYYQAPCVVLAAAMGWGCNLLVWSRMKIEPHPLSVFELRDARVHMTHREVFRATLVAAAATAANLSFFLTRREEGDVDAAANAPALLYVSALVVLLMPARCGAHPHTRRFISSTLARCVSPTRTVTFGDFFVADVLCSMAKSVSDVERATCGLLTGGIVTGDVASNEGTCGGYDWKVPVALALPSTIRFAQCFRQYADSKNASETGEGDANKLWNALKYFSAFPVIFLSALKYHVSRDDWLGTYRPAWIAFAVANTAFSYYWDVTHDWDLSLFTTVDAGPKERLSGLQLAASRSRGRRAIFLRRELLYRKPRRYYFALASNAALRSVWTYKLSSHLRHDSELVFLFTIAEIVRRFQWSLFRVEKEYLKLRRENALPK